MLSKALTKNVIVVEPFDPESIVVFFFSQCVDLFDYFALKYYVR